MKKYSIIEGIDSITRNAGSKAQIDCFDISVRKGYIPVYINGKDVKNIISKILNQLIIFLSWRRIFNNSSKGDHILLQIPSSHKRLGKQYYIKKMLKKGVIIISLIHDIEQLRCVKLSHFHKKQFDFFLSFSTFIIAHNQTMKEYLVSMGRTPSTVFTLGIFDYCCNPIIYKGDQCDGIIIAGNLDSNKATYISLLDNVLGIKFNLYGVGFKEGSIKNSTYFGSYSPDVLPIELKGKFGLVWDGLSIDTCCGPYGYYLSYNNPHKASLYLASGKPLIIWSKSAIRDFVIENNIGIVVDSLYEIKDCIDRLELKDYLDMKNNAEIIGGKIRCGDFLSNVLDELDLTSKYLKKNNII